MATLLKNQIDQKFIEVLATELNHTVPHFQSVAFKKSLLDKNWSSLELKQRIRKISIHLGKFIPGTYKQQINVLKKVVPKSQGLGTLAFPDFVEVHGLNDWTTSLSALKFFTPYMSSEFAIRPFILKNHTTMMQTLLEWADHPNPHIRRLSSEGCRPKLPWSFPLKKLINDPNDILPILEKLKNDSSMYVRKSVANNINDISKNHPSVILKLAKKWKGKSQATDWIIKHGLRTLLKKGNPEALKIFGISHKTSIKVNSFKVIPHKIKLPAKMDLNVKLISTSKKSETLRLEYSIFYKKKNGSLSKKVFQWKQTQLKQGTHHFQKSHTFKKMTTRTYYPGEHFIELILNGLPQRKIKFVITG